MPRRIQARAQGKAPRETGATWRCAVVASHACGAAARHAIYSSSRQSQELPVECSGKRAVDVVLQIVHFGRTILYQPLHQVANGDDADQFLAIIHG